jgi:hypothetical protein
MGRGGVRLEEVVRSGLDTFIDAPAPIRLRRVWIMGNPPDRENYSSELWKKWVDEMLSLENDPEMNAFFESVNDLGSDDPDVPRHIELVVLASSTVEATRKAEEFITKRLELHWLEDVAVFL